MKEKNRNSSHIAISLGIGAEGGEISFDLLESSNLLIAGKESSKEKLTDRIILSITKCTRPEDVRIVIIDTGEHGLDKYNDDPHLLACVQKRLGPSLGVMDYLADEAEHRLALFASAKVNDIFEYNNTISKNPALGEQLPHLVCMIDGTSKLLQFNRGRFTHLVTRVSSFSQIVGIHLVISTETNCLESTTSSLFRNFSDKIVFGHKLPSQFLSILGHEGADEMGENELLYYQQGDSEFAKVKSIL